MSELTRCNYCSLKDMEQKAKERRVVVIMGKDDAGWITARYSDERQPAHHFMELTDHCVC